MADAKNKSESDKKSAKGQSPTAGLEKTLDELFVKNSPVQLPDGAKEWIVKYGPWVLLVFIILSLPGLLTLLRLVGFLSSSTLLGYVVGSSFLLWVSIIANIVALVMTGFAIPGLLERKMDAWRLLFYSQLVNVAAYVVAVFSVSAWFGRSFFSIISIVLGLYILFQIRDKYKA